jgi:hypothetical protein
VVHDLRERVEIHLGAAPDDLLDGARLHHARREGPLHGPQVRREHGVGRAADRGREPGAARVEVREDGERRALDVLEEEHGAPAALLLELHDQGGDLVGRVDGARDHLELVRLPLLDRVEVPAEVLAHGGHCNRPRARRGYSAARR